MGGKDVTIPLLEFIRVCGWLLYILHIQVSFAKKFSDHWKKVEKEGARFVEKSIPSSIDPLILTGALITVFIAIVFVIRKSCDPPPFPRGERYYESYESMRNQNGGYQEIDLLVDH
ncbi:hypothetical protein PRIPAC_71929 [Pristionchus pacificus]|uniref:Uncharacterized protein n=1 Tax=Pristionchus pacificus TaxID=54126 RepID=A0A2A6C9S8_PRIPA|nr:hypothetical protein PRIPAC_71929 [Pristionchus pacificus]|eukprot:PDM74934.1 hypothetical protein PRIPAC_40315 [Pristionchus pacificus]